MNMKCMAFIGVAVVLAWNPLAGGILVSIVVAFYLAKGLSKRKGKATTPGTTTDTTMPAITALAMSMAGDRLDRFLGQARADLGAPGTGPKYQPSKPRPKVTTYFE